MVWVGGVLLHLDELCIVASSHVIVHLQKHLPQSALPCSAGRQLPYHTNIHTLIHVYTCISNAAIIYMYMYIQLYVQISTPSPTDWVVLGVELIETVESVPVL